MQWEFTFPTGVSVEVSDITAGPVAEAAQKALTCRAVEKANANSQGAIYACILAGGQKPIPNGPIVAVRYRVSLETGKIEQKVHVGKALGATADLKRVEFEDTQGAITVE